MTNPWKRDMGGGNETTGSFRSGKLFCPLCCRGMRINVKVDRDFGLRQLHRGNVHKIALKLDTLALTCH